MFKYMKYEIKGTYKFISGVLLLVFLLFTIIYAYTGRAGQGSSLGQLFAGLSVLILFGTALVVFLYIVGSFRKELYEDCGYLTFTLPLTGNQIVGSKLVVALMWFFILAMLIAIYNIIMILTFRPFEMNIGKLFALIQGVPVKETAFGFITAVLTTINLLVLIYFSMSLSKVTFRNKKIGGLWFILFLVVSSILGLGDYEISKYLPYYLDLNNFHLNTMTALNNHYKVDYSTDSLYMGYQSGIQALNLASFFYNIVTTAALFLGTGYWLEKKINL